MKKISNKGFTLIELLATILIIGLVLGITTYGIISSVNKAKKKSTILSLTSVKEAARIYSGELGEDSWKNISGHENTYFCVTIEELINKGLLNKNANSVENGGKTVDYVVVVKNKTTKVIEKEEILTGSNSEDVSYQICTGNIKNENITSGTQIGDPTSYTDTVYINFTDAVFESKITERYCEYGESSTNMNNKGTITGNTCTLEGLTQNKTYYTRVCEISERGSKSCSSAVAVKTQNIVAPTIAVDTNKNNSVKITYDNSNIVEGNAFYYLKSTVGGISSINVSTCSLNNDKYTCNNDSVNNITKDTWYKVSNKEISITYSTPGNITVTAETRDKSNNSNSSTKEFSLYKTTFNRGNADTIGGQANNIELMCLANKLWSCDITSPSIEREGYEIVGWNTNSSATTSDWGANASKPIKSNKTYYPITKSKSYTITYDANGGDGAPAAQTKTHGTPLTLSSKQPTKTGYTFKGWGTSSTATSATYQPSESYSDNSSATLYAVWQKNKVIIKFSVNGGTIIKSSQNFTADNNGIIDRTMEIEYGESIGKDGLLNYNNENWLNIQKTESIAVSGKEWECKSNNCKKETYDQNINYNDNAFCDASSSDCTVTLGVNWEKYKEIYDYRCVGSDYYFVTTCRGEKCNYNRKNCNYDTIGTIDWNSTTPSYCSAVPINADRCIGNDIYHIETCTAASCKYTSKNGVSVEGTIYDRCALSTNCKTETKTMYVTASSGLNCRSDAGANFGVVTAYACGTAIKVNTTSKNNWYYSVVDNCYASGVYLSETKPTCSSSSSGGSSGGDFSGYLSNCTCNSDSDCGKSGTNIKVWCNTSYSSGNTSGGRYMCAWQNAATSGGFTHAPTNTCW